MCKVDGKAICEHEHQVSWSQATWPGRFELLELGHAAATQLPKRQFIDRLRNADGYLGAAAELRARHMLRMSGAKVRAAKNGQGPGLAEFLCRWPSRAEAIVEVKSFHQGKALERANNIVVTTQQELAYLDNEVSGFRGKLTWSNDLFDAPLDDLAILFTTRRAIERAKELASRTRSGHVVLEGIGILDMTRDTNAQTFRVEYGGYAPSKESTFKRLHVSLDKAMRQCATHPNLPAIVVLDVDAFGLARNALGLVEAWAAEQPQLGVIVIIEREHAPNASYGNVRLIGGRRAEEVADLCSAFEFCEEGHLHYQPLCSPGAPCESLFWLFKADVNVVADKAR